MNSITYRADEIIKNKKMIDSYHKIVQKQRQYFGGNDSDSDEDDDPSSTLEPPPVIFDVEAYLYSFNDRIKSLFDDPKRIIYMDFHTPPIPKIHVTRIHFEFVSNCCVMVTVDFDHVFTNNANKRKLCEKGMELGMIHQLTHQTSTLFNVQPTLVNDDDVMIHSHQLVINQPFDCHQSVAFDVVNEFDLKDMSLWFRIGYLDYTFF